MSRLQVKDFKVSPSPKSCVILNEETSGLRVLHQRQPKNKEDVCWVLRTEFHNSIWGFRVTELCCFNSNNNKTDYSLGDCYNIRIFGWEGFTSEVDVTVQER